MLFNSLIFTLFLPIVFISYWLLPGKLRKYFLLLASYYFYFSYNPVFLLLLVGTSALDYYLAQGIYQAKSNFQKQLFLYTSLASNLGVLFAFKYFVFLYNSAQSVCGNSFDTLQQFIIPAGLSFYTFQSLSYTVDIYRGKYPAQDTLFDFLLFVSFFPHMVAGPIVRYQTLMPQLKVISFFKQINWSGFATLVIWGYFKKLVIADNLNGIVSRVFNDVTQYGGLELLLAGFLFVIQVYCDFSGYSDIATGVAKLFNIHLSLNWRRPLLSKSLHEFWQRNHISITNWFRDYLYIGLGGNRVSYYRWLINIFLVFLISGFWHGANVTFVIWGALHGLFYILEILLKKKFPQIHIPAFLGWFYLISFHTVSLIAFRANNLIDLSFIYRTLLSFDTTYFSISQVLKLQSQFYFLVLVFVLFLLLVKELNEEFGLLNKHEKIYKTFKPIAYILFIVLIFTLGNFSANSFIYFQF